MAEAYLGYAEALNESSPAPTPDVYKYVNLIRERAGIPAFKEGLSKEEMRAAIQQDRKSTRLNSSHRCTSRMPSSA